ncbi:MAG: hypothetical protein NVSMB64_22580 [Candidatus Velthaea sp.]
MPVPEWGDAYPNPECVPKTRGLRGLARFGVLRFRVYRFCGIYIDVAKPGQDEAGQKKRPPA